MDIQTMTAAEIAAALSDRKISSKEVCRACLDRVQAVDPKIKAFLEIDADAVLAQAEASDARRAAGAPLSPLDGVPIALKDNMTVKGQICSCASKILAPYRAPYDSGVVRRLKANGLVLFGRANMDEFAMGSSCENSAFFPTRNPWDPDRVPGGSSGGSAAAVSAGMVPLALGSDTGGSIRQPAGFCGAVGVKPTYGRVSRYGLVAFASSLDQIGPFARTVEDAAWSLDMISGQDPMDATSLPEPPTAFAEIVRNAGDRLDGVKIGLPKEYLETEGLAPTVRSAFETAVDTLRAAGAEIVPVSLPRSKYAIAAYYVIATAEAGANLARFDGVRYGARVENSDNLTDLYFQTRGRGFGAEVKRRILLGTFVLSSGYYDAYYLRAQKVRTLVRQDFEDAFKRCDVILSPVSPTPAFRLGEISDPVQMYLADIFTISANLAGICGACVPATLADGLPVGVQFLGPVLGENAMFKAARVFETRRACQNFVPPL